ncbi:hypothetical protein P9139_12535 [Curtobacterium flaccumfaciens]|nr:hypothetical protein P9139_12535 [Curtobacterium flaccumfaciens]
MRSPESLASFEELKDPDQLLPVHGMMHLVGLVGDEAMARGEAEEQLRWAVEAQASAERRWNDEMKSSKQRVTELERDRSRLSADVDNRDARLEQQAREIHRIKEALRDVEAEKAEWRTAARKFRAEVQRFRDRRTTKILDVFERLRGR